MNKKFYPFIHLLDEFFPTERDFDEHSRENCTPHQCTKCEDSFKTFTLLEEHIRKVHVIVKPKPVYNCKICGNSFGGHAQLSAHKKLHEERPFKCNQCSKAYPRRVDLDIHMRTHTGELPYKCHLCDKGFAIKVRLTYHLQKHEGVTHNCPHCPAVYDNRNKLKAHLFKHTGMPYKCEICPNVGFHRRLRYGL